ncbi:hypothetical protein THAOC_37342 [Thalassiosira oceanica]|uniref:FAD-binding FR-type domain-containing protein n=1 Tax=Thalassiosira oceanica TaxID=159749 RepID=K0R6C9_THAOC|nr:hypothetical protein THAOC_37342 [Thalassiosira oceanica]|eukprot:EJK44146.1 hypothetical protein THAOC_37342 [Thalassiosira oceanica]
MATAIFVCQAGSCRRRGSEAVLVEIEELAGAVDPNCKVEGSGCLGQCNMAPAAVVVQEQPQEPMAFGGLVRQKRRRRPTMETYFTNIDSLDHSCRVVRSATGIAPPTDDPTLQQRLAGVRHIRARDFAVSVYRWNAALQSTTQLMRSKVGNSAKIREEMETFYDLWVLENVTIVSKHSAVFHFRSFDRRRGTPNPRGGGRAVPTPKTWHTTLLAEVGPNTEGPLPWIERDYTPVSGARQWEQGTCDILIKIYEDGAATSWLHKISSDLQNQNRTSTAATTEPATENNPVKVWLSQPVQTLAVPSLVPGTSFNPASVLLLLAGTGVVALPQIVHHRDPYGMIGISMRRSQQLLVPIDMILSCRRDDVLMVPEILDYCQQAHEQQLQQQRQQEEGGNRGSNRRNDPKGLRNTTILLTGMNQATTDTDVPYPFCSDTTTQKLETLHKLPNARVLEGTRLSPELVQEAVANMPTPCRVVVSGPSGFNSAARGMLIQANVEEEAITILEA